MVYVCDSIMGSGKSSAAITYMNEHPEQRFIYITPYKTETERIQSACPHLNFVRPSKKIPEYHFKKTEHIAALIKDGCNVSTTHQAFREFGQEMKDDIKSMGYTLIIDEDVSSLENIPIDKEDVRMAVDANRIRKDGDIYSKGSVPYNGTTHRRMISVLDSRDMVMLETKEGDEMFYWLLPPDLIACFNDVYVLTYLFDAQSLRFMFDMYGFHYTYIYVKNMGFRYEFTDEPGWIPEYVRNLRDKIHVLDNKKLNNVGNRETSLSINWMKNNPESVKKLKNAIYNYFHNIAKCPSDERMWGTYKGSMSKLKGDGYTKSFVAFNTRATNEYASRTTLVYAVNVYMNVAFKSFYADRGVVIDKGIEDVYALSMMVQWIWRSAIRNGGDINIYIPSRRMRTLLINWMDALAEGGDPYVGKKMCPVRTL